MEQEGEFGQQPEVQSGDLKPIDEAPSTEDAPPQKSKGGKAFMIACIVAAVVVLGLGILLITLSNNNGGNASTDKKDGESSKTDKKDKSDDDDDDEDDDDDDDGGNEKEKKKDITPVSLDGGVDDETIQGIFEAIEEGLNDAKIEVKSLKAYKDYPLAYEYKKGYATELERSYGIEVELPDEAFKTGSFDARENVQKVFVSILTDAGFSKWDNLDKVESMGGPYHTYKKGDYYCAYLEQEENLACGNTGWLSQEQQDFMTTLADVYHEANKDGDSEYTMIMLGKKSDIKDSEVKPYQTLHAGTSDAWIWYYRKSPNDKWIFVTAGNGGSPCNETFYATEELKNAFKGVSSLPCY